MSQHNNIWSHQNLNFYDTPFSQHPSLQERRTPHPFIFFNQSDAGIALLEMYANRNLSGAIN